MIAMIAAYANNRVIGKNGSIPWKIPGEQKQFRELTTGNGVVMGRVTYESIGRPLPNRTIYVVSTSRKYDCEGVITVSSLLEAICLCKERDLYIAGGQSLYEEGMQYADLLYLTEIDMDTEGDRYFPPVPEDRFVCVQEEVVDGETPYTRSTWKRIEK